MIVVRVEIWPGGDEARKRLLGTMQIANDGAGGADAGHYDVRLQTFDHATGAPAPHYDRAGRVTDFPRRRRLVWALLYRAIAAAFPSKNWR